MQHALCKMLRESLYVIFLSHTKSRCSDTMYDFCFGPIYAALLGLGELCVPRHQMWLL